MKYRIMLAAVATWLLAAPANSATIIVNNVDPPGVGFNDPTPAQPVGGNTGTTVGQQRLIAYAKALELWGNTLQSRVRIVVQGSFARLDCDETSGTLALSGPLQIFADFPKAPLAETWYPVALTDAIVGNDLTPGPPDPGLLAPPFNDDIVSLFNGAVGQPDCIAGGGWYYGLDSNPGPDQIDFLDTFMHEVAHGLGFATFADLETGELFFGLPDVYMANTLDLDLGRTWDQLSSAQIVASAINNGRVVWSGVHVSSNMSEVLGDFQGIRLTGDLTDEIVFGQADFGAEPSAGTLNGDIVLARDNTSAPGGGTPTDGCEAIKTNVKGKVALVDRGLCTFTVKAHNAQVAGAKAVVIANTLGRPEFAPGGGDPTITITAIGISNADGDAIKAVLPGVGIEFFVDPTRVAGEAEGYVRLYAPSVLNPGSSLSHFDVVAHPNLLMEPAITESLRANENVDLTGALMQDLGWRLKDLVIASCNSGAPGTMPNGDMLHAKVQQCAASSGGNKSTFVTCVNNVAVAAKKAGYITADERAAIRTCATKVKP